MCCRWSVILLCAGQGQPRITVTPTQLNLTPNTTSIGGTVTVKCEPPSTGVSTLLGLVIYRVLYSNPNAPRAEVVAAGSDQNNGNPSLTSGSSVTDTVDGSISQNFISLTMSQAKCRDGGMYICEASYFKTGTGNIVETLDVPRNLTVEGTDWFRVVIVEASCLSSYSGRYSLVQSTHCSGHLSFPDWFRALIVEASCLSLTGSEHSL